MTERHVVGDRVVEIPWSVVTEGREAVMAYLRAEATRQLDAQDNDKPKRRSPRADKRTQP